MNRDESKMKSKKQDTASQRKTSCFSEEFLRECDVWGNLIKEYGLRKATEIMHDRARKSGRMGTIDTNNIYEQELEHEKVCILSKIHRDNLRNSSEKKNDGAYTS